MLQFGIIKVYKGFRIGLNIVLSICKEYNIKLDLDSQKGKGNIFTLTFPKVKQV